MRELKIIEVAVCRSLAFEFYVSEQEFKEHLINLDLAVRGAIIRKQLKVQQNNNNNNNNNSNNLSSEESEHLDSNVTLKSTTSNTNGSTSYESLSKLSSSSLNNTTSKVHSSNESIHHHSRQGREDSIVFGLGGSTPKFTVNRKTSSKTVQ